MTDRDQIERGQPRSTGVFTPVPAARPLSDFSVEQVGDDLVILDGETMQYHTLNGVAQRIWRACDGVSSVEAIAASTSLPVEVVETTIAELGEASLLVTPASTWSVSMSRRRAAKLIAAGAVGAVGVPVVLSITAPNSASAASPNLPNEVGVACTPYSQNGLGCAPVTGSNPNMAISCCNTTGTSWQCWSWNSGPCQPSFVGGASTAPEPIEPAEFFSAVDESDPYLGDVDGNVDLNTIQIDSVEQPVTDPPVDIQAQPEVQQSAPEVVVDTAPADESVDTSSGDEGTPADGDNG